MLLPPMVKLSICWRSLDATCFMASLFVTKMVVATALKVNQKGIRKPPKTAATTCRTMAKTIHMFKVKNGILLTMNPGEHTGWTICDAGRMAQAQISDVSIARTVRPAE